MAELQLKHRFDEIVRASSTKITGELYGKAVQVITEIEHWYRAQGKVTRTDAERLYGWRYSWDGNHRYGMVPTLLDEHEFKVMASLCFRDPTWLARLLDPSQGAEHIHAINRLIGQRADRLLEETDRQNASILDLGAGTLGTLTAVISAVQHSSRRLTCAAVDLTPELVVEAKKHAEALRIEHGHLLELDVLSARDMVGFLETCKSESFDVITASFCLHHLHPREQVALIQRASICLRPQGALLLADPQEGKSPFNLENLVLREPEGVFASFAPVEDIMAIINDSGLTCEEPLAIDNQDYTAYALAGLKLPMLS